MSKHQSFILCDKFVGASRPWVFYPGLRGGYAVTLPYPQVGREPSLFGSTMEAAQFGYQWLMYKIECRTHDIFPLTLNPEHITMVGDVIFYVSMGQVRHIYAMPVEVEVETDG